MGNDLFSETLRSIGTIVMVTLTGAALGARAVGAGRLAGLGAELAGRAVVARRAGAVVVALAVRVAGAGP